METPPEINLRGRLAHDERGIQALEVRAGLGTLEHQTAVQVVLRLHGTVALEDADGSGESIVADVGCEEELVHDCI